MTTDDLVSIIIPSRNEIFLHKTLQDILKKAKGNIEIIAILDGYYPPSEELIQDDRLIYLHFGTSHGMREAINGAAAIARGKYLLKCDGHVLFDEGFDVKLMAGVPEYHSRVVNDNPYIAEIYADNWIVIPRRKRLDAEAWKVQDVGKPDVDYEFLSSPADAGVKGNIWTERILERLGKPEYDIDENMTFQGSCWFMTKNHYINRLGGMSEQGYGTFVREAQEIGLKTWLGGGKVFINKKTWYAHLHKGKTYGRGYFLDKYKMDAGNAYCDDFWFNNKWKDAKRDLAWLIEHFSPVPTWTPELIEQVRKKMKIYLQPDSYSRGIVRVADALMKYKPDNVELVLHAQDADFEIIHVTGRRDTVERRIAHLKAKGKPYAMIQYCLRSTKAPHTKDWLNLWKGARVVWSYYDLFKLLDDDRVCDLIDLNLKPVFNFYYQPLGVDPTIFYERETGHKDKTYTIAASSQHALSEGVRECVFATKEAGKRMFFLGHALRRGDDIVCRTKLTDDQVAEYFSDSKFVSGLRRTEGFEFPVIEGALCGARPIVFDRPEMKKWYSEFAIFINEGSREEVIAELVRIFSIPESFKMNEIEKEQIRKRFDWERIITNFWKQII